MKSLLEGDFGIVDRLDLLQASLSFKFEIVRRMQKMKNEEERKGIGERERRKGKGGRERILSPSPLFLFFFLYFSVFALSGLFRI